MDHPDSIRNDTDSKTLSRLVMVRTKDPELVILLNAIQTACKLISRSVRKAGIAGLCKFQSFYNLFTFYDLRDFHIDGLSGTENTTGDEQKKLDVLSNEMMVNSLYNSHVCAVLVSEENEDPIIVEPSLAGKYCVAFDPLDGSSNIDCNVSTGTIFAVWLKKTDGPATVADILRPGEEVSCCQAILISTFICFPVLLRLSVLVTVPMVLLLSWSSHMVTESRDSLLILPSANSS
jgi:fructose-1,6-bisphosphatase I